MRIHYLQHESFEDLGNMEPYFRKQNYRLTSTHLYINQKLPSVDEFDWLIIMGGPMSIHDEKNYPWLIEEKLFIRKAIDSGKKVLGICLGSQLIANVLGARVEKNPYPEIGWYPVELTKEAGQTTIGKILPQTQTVFHWHNETFQIPEGGIRLFKSEPCPNQGYVIDNRIFAFQFHPEATVNLAKELIKNCAKELEGSKYVQSEKQILTDKSKFNEGVLFMEKILGEIEKTF